MSAESNSSLRPHELGQLFGAWIVGIFVVAAMIIYLADSLRRSRAATESTVYRELALNVAKAGFEDGLSFFRTHSSGCYLNSSIAPTSQAWVQPWPTYPDAAFLPQAANTEFYSNIALTDPVLGATAGGIIGDIPMDQYVTYTGSTEMTGSSLWGRYVIRRQNIQDWSPGPDTMTVNTDPDACHDISAVSAQSPLGSGTRWSIVSHGYLIRLPSPVTTTSEASSLLGQTSSFTDHNMLSAPLSYINGQPFVLAQARVYGEMSRINFNLPTSAAMLPSYANLTVNAQGILDGGSFWAWTANNAGTCGTCGGSGGSVSSGQGQLYNPTLSSPSIAGCFPGQTWASLQNLASALSSPGGQIQGYTLGLTDLPVCNGYNSVTGESFTAQVNQPAFYFSAGSITLTSATSGNPVLSGVGLCVIEGSLYIPAGNQSSWDGVIYAKGLITLDGPTTINGIIISETGIIIANTGTANDDKTTVSYDSGVISQVQGLLQDFTVDSSSIVATQF